MTSTPNDSSRPDDERIAAWVDGELDDDGIKAMDQLALNDQPTAARAQRLRQLDDLARAAVPLEETIPDDLLARMGLAEYPAATAEVIDLGSARAARQAQAVSRSAPGGYPLRRLAASVALLVGLGFGVLLVTGREPEADGPYRTLSSPAQPGPSANAMIMVAADASRPAIEAAARRAGAEVLGETAETGAIRLAIDPVRRDAVLEELRTVPGVTMAEPLDGARP